MLDAIVLLSKMKVDNKAIEIRLWFIKTEYRAADFSIFQFVWYCGEDHLALSARLFSITVDGIQGFGANIAIIFAQDEPFSLLSLSCVVAWIHLSKQCSLHLVIKI